MKYVALMAFALLILPASTVQACEGFHNSLGALEQVVGQKQASSKQTMTPTAQMTVDELRKESLNRNLTRLEQAVLTSYENKATNGSYANRAPAR